MVSLNLPIDPLATALREYAPVVPLMEPHLEAAILQVTTETGKLVRARLVLAAARAHGLAEAEALPLATAVEYFHTASLLLDDLPCMDDATTRRGHRCVHRVHGEATAILAALALINRAYLLLGVALAGQSEAIRREAMAGVDACLGPAGLVGGQAADLRFRDGPGGARAVSRIATGKTGALFWLAVYLPALLAQPEATERRALKALCVNWGLAFQALDDLGDLRAAHPASGKDAGNDVRQGRPNLALALGVPATRARVSRQVRLAGEALDRLQSRGARWSYLRRFEVEYFAVACQQGSLGVSAPVVSREEEPARR